mgnify:CR=1 FL=1
MVEYIKRRSGRAGFARCGLAIFFSIFSVLCKGLCRLAAKRSIVQLVSEYAHIENGYEYEMDD